MKLLASILICWATAGFILFAHFNWPETETFKQPFFTDHDRLMQSHQNKHLECLGEIYAFVRLLVKMERTEHPVFTKPDAYYLACMRAKGMVF